MSASLDPHYDFALLGTSLPLSILSAALSRAGYSVLHVDEEEHYGGPWSSLTLLELLDWSRNTTLHTSQGRRDVIIEFPAFGSSSATSNSDSDFTLPEQLKVLNRHFSISLSPTIVPCAGPTIDILIRSKVASYCTFRLLQKTAIYHTHEGDLDSSWSLRKVPSSKEDIFKDKDLSLIDKRKLMKLLQKAGPGAKDEDEVQVPIDTAESKSTFFQYLCSKEGANLSHDLATNVAYGVALCSSEQDLTIPAMERIRRHITSIGRYGNAAYLVGQYGGAGEMAQCFCRASAVQGGTFVLGHRLQQCSRTSQNEVEECADRSNWSVSIEGIEGRTGVEYIVGDEDVLQRVLPEEEERFQEKKTVTTGVSAILLLDRGITFENSTEESKEETALPPPETGLVIFPPRKDERTGAVTALQMAEGTFSCPKGMYLVYLHASLRNQVGGDVNAKEELRHARDRVLKLASRSTCEWREEGVVVERGLQDNKTIVPLMEVYYSSTDSQATQEGGGQKEHYWSATSKMSAIATSLDEATVQAERLFWDIVGKEKREEAEEARRKKKPIGYTVGRGLGGVLEEKGDTGASCDFFPSEDANFGDDDDE
ncbi:hypothetical protein CBS101457_000691 [Exobasidium rhododendri]|nr:hypothetical protein CBS101457_000691 [Exobasidium rhododendri]